MKRIFFLLGLFSFVISLRGQINVSVSAGPSWYSTEADQVSEIFFLAGGGEGRSSYNISQAIGGFNLGLGVGYELSDRWMLRFHGLIFSGETTYFEDRFVQSGDIFFDDFDAPAEMQTLNLGLGVGYRVYKSDKLSLDMYIGPFWNQRTHEYMNYQEYENTGDAIVITRRDFTELEVSNLGGFLEAKLLYAITDQLDLTLSSAAFFLDDADNMYNILFGAQYSLSQ